MEKLKYQVADAAWILLLFRDAVDTAPGSFVVQYVCLLFIKYFHWLCEARVERMAQQLRGNSHCIHTTPTIFSKNLVDQILAYDFLCPCMTFSVPMLGVMRVLAMLAVLLAIDVQLSIMAAERLLKLQTPSLLLVFGFETCTVSHFFTQYDAKQHQKSYHIWRNILFSSNLLLPCVL